MRRLAPEPAATLQEGRPTKRDRREIDKVHKGSDWGSRWSASIDE
jgi:ribosome-associated heat shock protein Hsp15